ncbi:MAG: magnesium/cobalt transporter CorA [Chloroflexota bacterium]|nr:magnesium/cobalt transporter CorA [Chloroflexota bacterium]
MAQDGRDTRRLMGAEVQSGYPLAGERAIEAGNGSSVPPGTMPPTSMPALAAPKIKTVACLSGVSLERNVPAEEIRDYIADPDTLVWMDIQDPGPEELAMLLEEFGFHPLALEDVATGQQRPKVDEYKGYMFVVTYGVAPSPGTREVQTFEVDLFIGRNYVVSLHHGRVPALEDAYGRWTRGGAMLSEGVGFLVYTMMDAIIDAYFPIVDAIEDKLDETELEMFTRFNEGTVQTLLELKRKLVTLRRVLYPLRETFNLFLRGDQSIFSANTRLYFQDVYDHILRILDVVDIERDMVASALDAHLTVISNRLNVTMKTLTVVSICVGGAGGLFGAWGMNIGGIPFADTPFGFFVVFGGTIVLIAAVLLVGRKRGWL